jgi:hypothetical protein
MEGSMNPSDKAAAQRESVSEFRLATIEGVQSDD